MEKSEECIYTVQCESSVVRALQLITIQQDIGFIHAFPTIDSDLKSVSMSCTS